MVESILAIVVIGLKMAWEIWTEILNHKKLEADWRASQDNILKIQVEVMQRNIDKIRKEANQASNLNIKPPSEW